MSSLLKSYLQDIRYALGRSNLSSLRRKSILITGARGLVGSALVDLCLENEMLVYAAGRSIESLQNRFSYRKGNALLQFINYDACTKPNFPCDIDLIVHGAANAHPTAYAVKPFETMTTILCGTQHILNVAQQLNIPLLMISSSEVYGKKASPTPYAESDYGFVNLLDARSCYPVAKRAAETMCAVHATEFGTRFLIARPGHVFGPTAMSDDSRVAAFFTQCAAHHQNIILKSRGEQIRSWCYSTDCATALLTLFAKGSYGMAYNISSKNKNATIREFAQLFSEIAGLELLFDIPNIRESAVFNPMDNSTLDGERLAHLGWRPNFTLRESVRKTIEQYEFFI